MPSFPPQTGIVGILLAAGMSRRMGTPKPLLLVQGEPLARRMARTLREGGAEQVIIIVPPDAVGMAIAGCTTDLPGVITVVNPTPERGMLSSVQVGIQQAGGNPAEIVGWLICPCDLPLLKPANVAAVLKDRAEGVKSITVPIFEGKRGHPTLFGNLWTAEILRMDSTQAGLNALLAAHPEAIREAPVEYDAIVCDADTPEEWQALMDRL